MNRFFRWTEVQLPLLKQGVPTRFGVDDIGALFSVLTQALEPHSCYGDKSAHPGCDQSHQFAHQEPWAETSLCRSQKVETTRGIKVVGVGITNNAERTRSLGANDLDAVLDQRSSNTTTPGGGVDEQGV